MTIRNGIREEKERFAFSGPALRILRREARSLSRHEGRKVTVQEAADRMIAFIRKHCEDMDRLYGAIDKLRGIS